MEVNIEVIKAEARRDMKLTRPNAMVFAVFWYAIAFASASLFVNVEHMAAEKQQITSYVLEALLILVLWLTMSIFSAGFKLFCLNGIRYNKASYKNLVEPFSIYGKLIVLYLQILVRVSFWSLLLVVPGIMAAYSYRLAPYLMLDNPNMSSTDCIRASKSMMHGHKGDLFMLDISFIGWQFASYIPFVCFWVKPYMELSKTCFYGILCGPSFVTGGFDVCLPEEDDSDYEISDEEAIAIVNERVYDAGPYAWEVNDGDWKLGLPEPNFDDEVHFLDLDWRDFPA